MTHNAEVAALHAVMCARDPEVAAQCAANRADIPDTIATLMAHIDRIARTPEERQYILDSSAELETSEHPEILLIDWALRLNDPIVWYGIKTSPGANHGYATTDEMADVPRLTKEGGTLHVQVGGEEPNEIATILEGEVAATIEARIFNAPEKVLEVVLLPHHGLVALSTAEELYIVTEAEFNSQV